MLARKCQVADQQLHHNDERFQRFVFDDVVNVSLQQQLGLQGVLDINRPRLPERAILWRGHGDRRQSPLNQLDAFLPGIDSVIGPQGQTSGDHAGTFIDVGSVSGGTTFACPGRQRGLRRFAQNEWRARLYVGEPSYTVGLQYEVPVGNNVARARHRRRQLELRQLQSQLAATLETLSLEVETSVREVETAYAEMQAKYRAMQAGHAEVQYITDRYRTLPGDEASAVLFLDNLLLAQDRLAAAEFGFTVAEVTYNLSLVNLKRAEGTLLVTQQVEQVRAQEGKLPSLILDSQKEIDKGMLTID